MTTMRLHTCQNCTWQQEIPEGPYPRGSITVCWKCDTIHAVDQDRMEFNMADAELLERIPPGMMAAALGMARHVRESFAGRTDRPSFKELQEVSKRYAEANELPTVSSDEVEALEAETIELNGDACLHCTILDLVKIRANHGSEPIEDISAVLKAAAQLIAMGRKDESSDDDIIKVSLKTFGRQLMMALADVKAIKMAREALEGGAERPTCH